MGEKLAFCLFFILSQGDIEDRLKVVGGGVGRESAGIGLRHDSSRVGLRVGEKRLVDGRKSEGCAQIYVPYCKELAHCLRPDTMSDICYIVRSHSTGSLQVIASLWFLCLCHVVTPQCFARQDREES